MKLNTLLCYLLEDVSVFRTNVMLVYRHQEQITWQRSVEVASQIGTNPESKKGFQDIYTEERVNRYGYKKFSRTKEEFTIFYENELKESIIVLEKERRKRWLQLKKRMYLVILFWIVSPILLLYDGFELHIKGIILFNIICFPLGYLAVGYLDWNKEIEQKVKQSIVHKMVHFMNPNFTYDPVSHISRQTFNQMLMFRNRADSVLGDDLIEGFVYDKEEDARTNVSFSEVSALNMHKTRTRDGKKRKALKRLAIGLFFKVDFNKDFGNSVTLIKPRWITRKRKYRKKLALYGKKTPLQEVHLENPAFMKEFIVHSNDQINSRVILQADTMQNLLDFVHYRSETLSGKQAKKRKKKFYIPYFTFRQNKIYVLLHTRRNHFTVNLAKELSIETAYDYFKDINRVLRLIDDLYLNLNLYKK